MTNREFFIKRWEEEYPNASRRTTAYNLAESSQGLIYLRF